MALWFAGASSERAPKDFRDGPTHAGKAHLLSVLRSHLDTASLEPSTSGRAQGKKRVYSEAAVASPEIEQLFYPEAASHVTPPASRRGGDVRGSVTPRQSILAAYGSHLDGGLHPSEPERVEGLRIVKPLHLQSPPKTNEKVFTSPPPPARAAPFASEENNQPAVPYLGMRRKVPEPANRHNPHDGDAFVLKRSRTPPAGAKFRETNNEGFAVILASSLKSRANPQIVPNHLGKSPAIKAEHQILERRRMIEEMTERAVQLKSEKALMEERSRVAHQQEPQRNTGRARCRTPPATYSSNGNDCPFAVNLPAPGTEFVGKPVIRQFFTPRRAVR